MDDINLDMHRSIDELGKFSVKLELFPSPPLAEGPAEELVNAIMVDVTRRCLDEGADMIGHVKAFLHDLEGTMLRANLISFRIGVEMDNRLDSRTIEHGFLMFHIIVHGLWDPQVRDISIREIDRIMNERAIRYHILQDYYEKEKRVK
jgi:hypothetical protein